MPKQSASRGADAGRPQSLDDARLRHGRRDEDGADSLFDVPAAVLCAFCGAADCAGCSAEDSIASGVVAIVPWERPDGTSWSRLWATANATTRGADAFFAALPDGHVGPAMRFAITAEALAVGGFAAAFVPLAVALLALANPDWAAVVVADPAMRTTVLRWLSVLVPAVSACVVVAHATHGLALDVGAGRQGARPQRRRALRAGLYACGWDLMASPLGALHTLVSRGVRAALGSFGDGIGMSVPRRAATALLQGVYGLRGDAVQRARRVGSMAALLLVIGSAVLVLALIAALRILS
ncbi:MAG: hypothetical protein WKG00_08265 [Polyangiaceae bacterium]